MLDVMKKVRKYCLINVYVDNTKMEHMISFVLEDITINNPFYSEYFRNLVLPVEYYGESFLKSDFLKKGKIEYALENGYVDIAREENPRECPKCSKYIEKPLYKISVDNKCKEELISIEKATNLIKELILDDNVTNFVRWEHCPHCNDCLEIFI